MPLLINIQEISKAFGAAPLFEGVSLTISDGDRLGLIGPNGAGKSTLLQILAGMQEPDTGVRAVRKLLRLGYVAQDSVFPAGATVGELLTPETFGKAGFTDPEVRVETLSGGWRKRLAIARELAREPDVLMLDEPTNHLDLEGILWLEKLLRGASFACVVVSHDRYFLENVATDMAELSRQYLGGLLRVKGNYSEFLVRREDLLTTQEKQQEALKNKVKGEIEWLRRGAKARTSKSKARIDMAGRLKEELADVTARNQTGTAKIDFQASDRKTKKLIELRKIDKSMNGRVLFRHLNLRLSPGRRVGLVGANGSGKSTLLKILMGQLKPDHGEVERADGVRMVYFDQNREQLDPEITLRKALVSHGDSVIYQDRTVHVMSWAKRFLFRAEQLEMPVGRLSGGEKARVLIAKLMLEPADVLLLDEPTNDLDIPTLEVLEENLAEFPGALVLVTHDRFMLDRVSNLVMGLDGVGGAEVFAEYAQWEQALGGRRPERAVKEDTRAAAPKKRLSYLESREWETIEERIAEGDKVLHACQEALQEPAVNTDPGRLQKALEEMEEAQGRVDELYERWAELGSKVG
jgi:ATP-binding cassette subfamily F protein uup